MEHQSRGLFDGFEFRRTPSGDEIETALTEGVISLDTNILLNLYRYEDTARDEFLAVLRQMKNRLFVTDQVATEFWRNRESVLGDRDSEGRKAREALEKAQTSAQNAIGAWANRLGVDDEKRSSLLNSLAEAIAATTVEIGEVTAGSRHSFDTNEDELLETIGQLVDGRVGVEAAADQQERDVSEGKRRAKERIPPGFADDDKDGDGIAGDYLVWRQSLRFAQSEGVDWLVFVSDDVKADWRRDEGASNPRARPELEREAWLDAGCRLLMLKSTALLRMAKGVLGLEVSEGTFTAVSSVATAHDQRWSASNIDEFVDLLAIRRPELADVVQRAAELGGTIDRSTVYEICGFDSDRKLNRFTMPATGLARQMTEDGDLPEGLDEPIWALYEGTGKAVGFGVPEEFVDFFAE
jgi:predicted nucleic acid-binding protein